jgi:diaminohydroxyphosphoribosylaminopyrimidine deaminase/5-amino-6-(5-phosphoribosylamino)uracil reductase
MMMAVTLEPCNHYGKTPPCSHAIAESGIKKVFIAKGEENSRACNGACYLKGRNIDTVFMDEFREEVEEINRFFFKTVRTSLPWITVKAAVSSDGYMTRKIGTPTAVTGKMSKIHTHTLRSEHMAIAIGANTVNIDDPQLNVREVEGKDPVPVIFSRNLNLDLNARVLKNSPIVITENNNPKKIVTLRELGAEVEVLRKIFSINSALSMLWEKHNINSIMLEGGSDLISAFLKENMIDEFQINTSPDNFSGGLKLFSQESEEIFSSQFHLFDEMYLEKDHLRVFRK